MSPIQLSLPGLVVKKGNGLIRARVTLNNSHAGKILATLIACIGKDAQEFAPAYRIQAKSVPYDLKGGTDYNRFKSTCAELGKATVELEFIAPLGKQFTTVPIFKKVNYYNGEVTASFNDEMKQFLLNLKKDYTQYNLIDLCKLHGQYCQRIFEILKSVCNNDKWEYEVVKLQNDLNIEESSILRKDFGQFRREVLDRAKKEIEKNTDFRFSYKPLKKVDKRKYSHILFIFNTQKLAIEKKKQVEAKQAEDSAKRNKYALAALDCAKIKGHKCTDEANNKEVCETCKILGYHDYSKATQN